MVGEPKNSWLGLLVEERKREKTLQVRRATAYAGHSCPAAFQKRNRLQKQLGQGASQSWRLRPCSAFSTPPRLVSLRPSLISPFFSAQRFGLVQAFFVGGGRENEKALKTLKTPLI